MKTILVDDSLIELKGFEIECGTMPGIEIVGRFTSPIEALEYAKNNEIDFALLDIKMQGMDGFELFDKLKEIRKDMIIVFVTAQQSAAVHAIKKKIDYIIFKPYDKEDVENVLTRVKLLSGRLQNKIYCNTFGKFDVFCDGKPIRFKSAKAKELFALCVYRRGALVSAEEIIDKLWANYTGTVGNCSIFRATVRSLVGELKQIGCEEVFCRERGACSIIEKFISSDYYDFLKGDANAICEYQGEFLTDYTWASGEAYTLNEKKLLIKPNSLIDE